MGLACTGVVVWILLLTFCSAKDVSTEEDLVAVESRYKVVAKPEPYQPPRPAPDDFEITTRRGIDGAEVIYPTTTYRPVDLYLPTKGSEKFLHNFRKTESKKISNEEGLESVEIFTKEKAGGGKKRIKKVRKVLRNSAARSHGLAARNSSTSQQNNFQNQKNFQNAKNFQSAKNFQNEKFFQNEKNFETKTEVRSLQPTIKPQQHRTTTTATTTTTTTERSEEKQFFQQQRTKQDQQVNPRQSDNPSSDDYEKSSGVLFQHSGDVDVRTNKKARGLAILSQATF
jgi:hypothetical protein